MRDEGRNLEGIVIIGGGKLRNCRHLDTRLAIPRANHDHTTVQRISKVDLLTGQRTKLYTMRHHLRPDDLSLSAHLLAHHFPLVSGKMPQIGELLEVEAGQFVIWNGWARCHQPRHRKRALNIRGHHAQGAARAASRVVKGREGSALVFAAECKGCEREGDPIDGFLRVHSLFPNTVIDGSAQKGLSTQNSGLFRLWMKLHGKASAQLRP